MQPYFMPYIGYFQLINEVDKFVIYDDIEYTKKGWINRNRTLKNGEPVYISLPLKKDSDYLHVNQRVLSSTWDKDKSKLLNQIKGNYIKAPFFKEVFPLVEKIVNFESLNLFEFIFHSVKELCIVLGIETKFIVSSSLDIDTSLKAQDKVLNICKTLGAAQYINPIGGIELYSKDVFLESNIALNFIQSKMFTYKQFESEFCPWLSIIDVMMFNSVEKVREAYLNKFCLI